MNTNPATAPKNTVRVKIQLPSRNGAGGTAPAPPTKPTHHRTLQLLALAHHYQHLLHTGQVKDLAQIALLSGVSRARVTQIANLAFLPVEVQERVIFGHKKLGEHSLRKMVKHLG